MDSSELIELFYNRTYEKFVDKQILDDKNYIVPRQQLTNYVHELVNIPYIDFVNYIKQNGIEGKIEASDITQFNSFSACEIEMCNALIWANNPGCQYVDIGRFFPNNIIGRSYGAYKRYGESHIKAATQLGLTFEYYSYWYLSCLGYIYPELDEKVRKQLLARTITRNRLYQQLLIDIVDHDVKPEVYMDMLSENIVRRRFRNVCTFFDICLTACKNDNIKTYSLIKSYEVFKTTPAIQLPPGTNKYLQTYLSEFEYRTLSHETTAELINKYRKGDHKAYDTLIKGYMRLVLNIAKIYYHKGVEYEDLIQEGTIGLIKAFNHFNTNINYGFSKYASWWILNSIKNALATLPHSVQLPLNIVLLHKKVWDFIDSFSQKQGYLPSVDDIDVTGHPDIESISYVYQLPVELNEITCLVENFDDYESDGPLTDDILEKESKEYYVNQLLYNLDKRSRLIIEKHYGIGANQDEETLETIGGLFRLTRERVRQIVDKSICTLRDMSGIKRYEAKKGDTIRIDSSQQVGRVIKTKMGINGSTILVLKMESGSIYEISAYGTPFRIIKNGNNKKEHPNPLIDKIITKTKAEKELIHHDKKNDEQYSSREVTELDGLKVGDKIYYNNVNCKIKRIIVNNNSSKLIIEYNNGVLDVIAYNKSKSLMSTKIR